MCWDIPESVRGFKKGVKAILVDAEISNIRHRVNPLTKNKYRNGDVLTVKAFKGDCFLFFEEIDNNYNIDAFVALKAR